MSIMMFDISHLIPPTDFPVEEAKDLPPIMYSILLPVLLSTTTMGAESSTTGLDKASTPLITGPPSLPIPVQASEMDSQSLGISFVARAQDSDGDWHSMSCKPGPMYTTSSIYADCCATDSPYCVIATACACVACQRTL
ncbi:hypothetical protein BDV19DRAFT_390511 [Aspergillus venezuelensis]